MAVTKNPRRVLLRYCRKRKICPYVGGFCDSKSCSRVDFRGEVYLCPEHPNPSGFMMGHGRVRR